MPFDTKSNVACVYSAMAYNRQIFDVPLRIESIAENVASNFTAQPENKEEIIQIVKTVSSDWTMFGIFPLAIILEKLRVDYFKNEHNTLRNSIYEIDNLGKFLTHLSKPNFSGECFLLKDIYSEIIDLRNIIIHHYGCLTDGYLNEVKSKKTKSVSLKTSIMN